jgi:hypothetical protein
MAVAARRAHRRRLNREPTTILVFQINPKFSQAGPSPAKSRQRKSKELALFSLDFLGGIEPFQRVMLTPWPLFSFLAPVAE